MTLQNPTSWVWPPIIDNARKNRFIQYRDGLLTLCGWIILFSLLQNFWTLVYDLLKPPIFRLMPEDAPNWVGIWHMFRPFVRASSVLILSILIVAILRRKTLTRTKLHNALSAQAEIDHIHESLGFLPSQIETWQGIQDADVRVDDDGHLVNVQTID